MPQERPNHYGHLLNDAPLRPIKTVHLPTVLEAQDRIQRRLFTAWAVAFGLAGIIGGLAAAMWVAEHFFQ